MKETIFKNSAKHLLLDEAIEAYKREIAIAVNDGKDLTIIIEEVEQ